ncbi:MAG: hypothetical protein R2940_04510 [Syntrophotaleaceae bacterium]
MQTVIVLKAVAVWAGILVLAVLNGLLREALLLRIFGPPAALIVSGGLLSALILLAAFLALPWLGTRRRSELLAVGIGWLLMTLVFEFAFGLWQGKSLQTLLTAYTFKDGNLWPAVLLVTALSPCLAAKLRGWA